jgi:hypothetical protein
MKKFATASALALLGLTAINAQAQTSTPAPVTESVPGVFDASNVGDDISVGTGLVSDLLQRFAPGNLTTASATTVGPDISVISGAINLARINGAIDISGTNVALSSMANNVSATATAVGSSSTAEAYAIAGAKLATTVIGAMNSATVDVAGRTSEATSTLGNSFGVNSLAAQDSSITLSVGTITGGLPTAGSLSTITADLGGATMFDVSGGSFDLAGLTNNATSALTAKVTDLQNIGVFNAAINVAAMDAGIKVAAAVDTGAWFLNPQTGVVNLSNISMATTAIGAMNSSITKLGTTLAK